MEIDASNIISDMISNGPIDKLSSWPCPVCGEKIERKMLNAANQGKFPEDYDYTLYESNSNFLLKIVDHVCLHLVK